MSIRGHNGLLFSSSKNQWSEERERKKFYFFGQAMPQCKPKEGRVKKRRKNVLSATVAKQMKKEEEAISEALPGLSNECWEKFDAMN